jgi:cell division septation protein DedD
MIPIKQRGCDHVGHHHQPDLSPVLQMAYGPYEKAQVSRDRRLIPELHRPKGIQMRRFILVAAISLMSANAYAGPSRGLSLASSEPVAEQPKMEQKAEALPSAVERPKLVAPQEKAKAPVAADESEIAAKPKKKHLSTEARVVYELHRHGIYW